VNPAPEVTVLPNAERLPDAAAREFVGAANTAIEARGEFIVALAGGSTPRLVYARFATEPFATSLEWSRVHILWGDDWCVPPDHEASNYRMACETLLDHVPVPEGTCTASGARTVRDSSRDVHARVARSSSDA
jgi:6-phosphogluconolactonase